MKEPAKLLGQAGERVGAAQVDVIMASALGMTSPFEFEKLVCEPVEGPAAAGRALGIFANTAQAVATLGEKPSDISYSAYLRRFKAYRTAGSADEKQAQAEAEESGRKKTERCSEMLAADRADAARLQMPHGTKALPVFFARLLGIDQLPKAILGQLDALQREAAVKEAIRAAVVCY